MLYTLKNSDVDFSVNSDKPLPVWSQRIGDLITAVIKAPFPISSATLKQLGGDVARVKVTFSPGLSLSEDVKGFSSGNPLVTSVQVVGDLSYDRQRQFEKISGLMRLMAVEYSATDIDVMRI